MDSLELGDTSAATVVRLSDLDRSRAADVAKRWPALPEAVRIAAVRRMAWLSQDRIDLSFGRVLRTALKDSSAAVRQLTIAAMWDDGLAIETRDLLQRLTDDPSEDVRAEAARVLGLVAERLVEDGSEAETAMVIRNTLLAVARNSSTPHMLAKRSVESIGVFADSECVREVIADMLQSDDDEVKVSALVAVGRSQDVRWLTRVLTDFTHSEPNVRAAAARACGLIGERDTLPMLARLGKDVEPEVRRAAMDAIVATGGRPALTVLARLASGADEDEAELIAAAVEKLLSSDDQFEVED